MMNRGAASRTLSVQEIQQRCQTLVLRLTNPENITTTTTQSEAKAIVSNARKAVDTRFYDLVEKHVMDKDKKINERLLATLQTSDNQEQLLESFLVSLYGKAVEQEEAIALQALSDEEKATLKKIQNKNKDNSHNGDTHKHHERKQKD